MCMILVSREVDNFQLVGVSPCRQTRKLALTRCRGVRRMHLNSNMSACEQAPVSQFGSSAHGSLLRANFQFRHDFTDEKLNTNDLRAIVECKTLQWLFLQ